MYQQLKPKDRGAEKFTGNRHEFRPPNRNISEYERQKEMGIH